MAIQCQRFLNKYLIAWYCSRLVQAVKAKAEKRFLKWKVGLTHAAPSSYYPYSI